MYRNYLKVTLKNLLNNKVFSLINILGLTVGMAACMLIILFVQDELSYDKFNSKADRIYRLYMEYKNQEGEFVGGVITPYVLAPTIGTVHESEIEHAVRVSYGRSFTIENGNKKFQESDIALADSAIFKVFDYELINGDIETALNEPFCMVINQSMATRFFGDEDPLGKTVTVEEQFEVKITGVMKDIPENAHAHYNAFSSMSTGDYILSERVRTQWGEGSQSTYILLKENTPINSLRALFPDFIENHTFGEGASDFVKLKAQNLLDIHLKSNLRGELEPNGNIQNIYIFSIVAFFVLIIACINYMNLSTARSSERSKEVGLRKVAGAHRSQIIIQFIGESVVIAMCSWVLALLLAEICLPTFNELAGKNLSISFTEDLNMIFGFLCLAIFTGVIAGSYPAFFLSSFKPASVLKGNKGTNNGKSAGLRKVLVIIQFSLSIVLIIGTIVINNQWQYLRTKDLGIHKDHMLIAGIPDSTFRSQYEVIKREILASPKVESMTASNKRMTRNLTSNLGYEVQDAKPNLQNEQNPKMYGITTVTCDADFFKTYGVEIVKGRDFSSEIPNDLSSAFIVNESAAKLLGIDDPVGKDVKGATFDFTTMDFVDKKGKIIGVVEDFHFESLDYNITPVMFQMSDQWLNWVSIKLNPDDVPGAVALIEKTFKGYSPEQPFNFTFLDEDIDQLYQAQEKVMNLFVWFAILAIVIACLGIFGLASFTAERRTKELGIRKVLGASASGLTLMITKDFLILVGISTLIAWPVAWYFMNDWLADFNYRIDLGLSIFLLASGMAVGIAILTVSSQAIKASLVNPVKALKHE